MVVITTTKISFTGKTRSFELILYACAYKTAAFRTVNSMLIAFVKKRRSRGHAFPANEQVVRLCTCLLTQWSIMASPCLCWAYPLAVKGARTDFICLCFPENSTQMQGKKIKYLPCFFFCSHTEINAEIILNKCSYFRLSLPIYAQ